MRKYRQRMAEAAVEAAAGSMSSPYTISARIIGGPHTLDSQEFKATLAEEQAKSLLVVADWDRSGEWWSSGRLSDLRALAQWDARLEFVEALPRSITFGRFLARMFSQSIGIARLSPKSIALAEAINAFVTLFDGVCDETPESLPALLPELSATFRRMDGEHRPVDALTGPASILLVELANACFRLLAPHFATAPPPVVDRSRSAIRTAFESEIKSLQFAFDATDIARQVESREALSSATFNATLQCMCLLEAPTLANSVRLADLSEACGRFFGWIDDVADLRIDRLTGQPNLVDLCAVQCSEISPDALTEFVYAETERRWMSLEEVVGDVRISDDLKFAAQAWLV